LHAWLPLYCADASLAKAYEQVVNQRTERQHQDGHAWLISLLLTIKYCCSKRQ
jgi:hypothetical protein